MSSGIMQGETVLNRRIVITVILAAISIGIHIQLMLMRIEAVGVDWIVAILGLAAVGILPHPPLKIVNSLNCNERLIKYFFIRKPYRFGKWSFVIHPKTDQ